MPIYRIQAPDGKIYRIEGPPGASDEDLFQTVAEQNPAAVQAAPKEGIMAALVGGAKRMGSTFETGLESLIDPNLAAQRGVARSEALGQEYAPAASLEKVKQAYTEKGLFPAAYEAISQIPGAISENVPNIAATLAGGRTGAMAGSVFGPVGALIGGGVGAAAPSLLQLYGSGLERQAQEGSKDVSRTAALGAAVPGAAAEVVSTYIPLGRTFIGKLLGPEAEKALARGTNQGIETAAKESVMATLAKGTAVGAGVEIPTEVGQQMLERLQAGLPLTTPDALKEYGESAYGAALVGGPFGAAARAAGRPGAREEYQALKQKEEQAVFDAERQAALDKYNAEEAEAQKQRDITRGQLGADTSQMLALPAPDKEVAPVDETRELINPVGDITRDELAPEVTKYIDKYRKDNGLPRLKTFSVEDVRDAMTQVNPKGERAALDSILTAKTGYTGEQKYTAENVLDAAVEKNVATETKGFNDFLARVTGTNTLDTMTQPQLFAAFKALKDMKREDTTQQLVLPEGSNASRYTQRQYDQALDYVRSSFEESGNKPLSTETILTDIKDSTKLETERDAMALLDAAIKNEDLSQSREVVFRTYREGQERPVATYRDKAKAQTAAKKQGLNVKEEALVQVAPAEAKVAPETKRAPLPTGYEIKESLLDSGTAPAEFAITPEGRGKRLTAVPTEGEATAKIPKLQALRAQRAAQMDANIAKSEGQIAKGQAQLDRLEADGKGDTEQYKVLQAKQASRVKTMNSRIELFKRQKEEFLAPLQAKPAGQKTLTRQAFTVSKDGKSVGSFPSRQAAEESILTNLPDEELAKVASDTRFGGITDRAVREQERRKEGKKGIEVKGTAEGLEKAGVETTALKEKLKTLEDKLVPLLSKFGLKDVALNVVKSIERNAEGSYIDKLIKIAMDAENPIRTMRHEALHAMKELGFFTDAQWKALEKQARDVWIDKYLGGQMAKVGDKVMTRLEAYKQMGLSEAEIIEEAIADAFGDFDTAGKAPPGMLQALFKRMQQFFGALRQALGGAGFESAEEIFGKIERGELRPQSIGETMGERLSLLRAANPDEVEISTQNPQGKKRIYDPITEMLSIDEAAVREAMKANPELGRRTIQAIKAYGFVPNGTPNNKVLEVFKQNIVNNLTFLYRRVPERIRQRSKLWYDGANKIATEMGEMFDVSMPQVAGIMAAMSPQKDWFQNVSMAERALDILTKRGNEAWDENMLRYADSYVKESSDRKEREKRQDAFEKIKAVAAKGTKLKDMGTKEAAAFIRAYDEAYHSRNYRIVTPEGGFGDLVRNLDGKPAIMMWSTYGPIEKTVSIFRDGSRSNISQQLGFEHKIRSFYNNIAAPNSDISHVTIDTHAVAAGLFEALAGTDPEVAQNFGATGSSDVIGVGGTYGLIADAYREAAQKAGVRAREMQSITWEAVRGLFSEEMKASIKPKVRAEWAKYKEGKQSFEETRERVIEIAGGITDPDWVGSGAGTSVADGGASYDKSFVPEGGVRLREAKDVREKLTFNLSAVTNSIPGLRELYQRAMGKDKEAYTVLQKVAESSLTHLLSGTNARVNVEYAKGVYLSDREPSISVQISFDEGESRQVLAALANFAESYNQQQIHVRQPTIRKPGHDFGDGSYATVVYEIPLKKELSNVRISEIIDQSGLAGFTVTPETLTAYWVKSDGNDESTFDSFAKQVVQVHELVAAKDSRPRRTVERLYVYGEGYGARIPYAEIEGQLRVKQSSDTRTPKIIAEYLTGEPVTTFKQKPLTQAQVKDQELLANVFDELPTNDLKNPLVKRAYKALAKALEEQYKVLPIKVILVDSNVEPYANSAEMREDVSKRNRFRVYKTTPETFGPPGSDFRGHPLLQDSGLTDINGTPMLYNDLLRAVHDYFAHNLTEAEFGPKGEMAAWRNHMAVTNDPLARWALTAETRAQNAWQNFRGGVQDLTLMQRGFADQKAALPPANFVLTGDAKVDQPMVDYIAGLDVKERLGSLKQDSALAKAAEKNMPKFSLRTYFPTAEEAEAAAYEKAPPSTAAFKRFFGASRVMEEGRPQPMFHASMEDFSIFRENRPIFVSPDAGFAEDFIRRRISESGSLTYLSEGEVKKKTAKIYPLWVRAETPFDYDNKDHVQQIIGYLQANNQVTDGRVQMAGLALKTPEKIAEGLSQGRWTFIEDGKTQEALKALGFDSFYTLEGGAKNLAVFKANQVKSITGNLGGFDEGGDIRYSLRSFNKGDLPQKGRDYILPQDTLLYHGAYKERADRIDEMGGVLLSRPPMRVSGGTTNEGGLIFFGGEETARRYANSEADPMAVQSAREFGIERLPGKVFETATDRPYKLINRYYKINKKEASLLTKALGLPDYKALRAGDPLEIAAGRASDYSNSNIDRYEVTKRTGKAKETIDAPWPKIFETLGVDGFFDGFAVALTANNGIRLIGKDGKLEKFSLPSVSTAAEDRVNATTTVRDNDGFVSRMLKAISPESRSYFRQQAINRYNQLSVIDKMRAEKMGGHVLMADQSAESAALMSDLGAGITASAMGFGNRMGGIPVYKNGVTTVINTGDQKGLIASLAPLAKYNDPKVYQYYQYWAAVKRGERLYAEGREQLIQPGDRKYADELLQKFPEFEQVQKDFNKFNEGLVQYMVDTGVLSEAQGREYVKHADYVPFYRQLNEEKTIGPNIFQSISGVKQPRKLKGGDAPLADFLETVVRNTQASIQAGIKNAAAQRAVNAAMDVGTDIGAERLNEVSTAPDTVTILEKGKKVSYRVADPLFIEAVKSLNIPELPFMTLLSAPSNTLRNLVTKDPGFMMANLMRDSLSAWVTSGQDIKPIIGTVQNFAKALAGRSPGLIALLNAGVVGGYEFSNVVEASAQELAKDMQRKYGSSTITDKALRPFTWVWEALEKGTEASDAATRIAVYERVMEETGNEAEALYRALEVMNFNRKGSSAVVRILTAAVPFLNARVQGLDVFYRASFGQMATKDAKAIQKAFWVRGMTMMALSSMYFFAVSDDEEYKKQEAETKDNYWIIPGVGKFPTPFEVGVLFKTIPERILAYSFKDDTGQDFKKSIQRALVNTFAFNPIPQTVKPVIEAATNYSFFTMRPIVGQGMEKVAPEFQVGPGTSKLAEMIGTELGLSPIKIDSIIRGYTGTIGMYGVQAIDAVLNANSDSPNASKRFEQLPIIKRFALDPEARGNITQYYELKNAVDSLAATSSLLEKSMKPDEWVEYMRENKGLFATTEYVRDLEKEMKELREMRRLVQTGPFSADSKRDYLTTIGQAENNLTKNIQTVKKLIASYQ